MKIRSYDKDKATYSNGITEQYSSMQVFCLLPQVIFMCSWCL